MLDSAVAVAVELLASAGWQGVLAAIVLAILYGLAKAYLGRGIAAIWDVSKWDRKPGSDFDEDPLPPAQGNWETDPNNPGGDGGGGG